MAWFHYDDGRPAPWFAKGSRFDPEHLMMAALVLGPALMMVGWAFFEWLFR